MDDLVTTDQLLAEISDYWDKRQGGNLYNVVDLFNSRFNDVNNTAEKIEDWRQIIVAEGTTLDLIGADEQAYRITQNDDAYRFWIWIKYLMARAQGTYPSFMKIGSSSLGSDKGFNIWKTGIRHVGVQIPYDLVPDLPTAKIISKNLQNMLALGIWIGEIHFPATISGTVHAGISETDHEHDIDDQKAEWWSGWSADIKGTLHIGGVTTSQEAQLLKAQWWPGWEETKKLPIHAGVASVSYEHENIEQKAIWWSPLKSKQEINLTTGSVTSSDDLTKQKGGDK